MEENKIATNKKAVPWFIGGIILAIVIYSLYFISGNKNKNIDPNQQAVNRLNELEVSSQSSTKTEADMLKTLEDLRNTSDKTK